MTEDETPIVTRMPFVPDVYNCTVCRVRPVGTLRDWGINKDCSAIITCGCRTVVRYAVTPNDALWLARAKWNEEMKP